MIGLEEVSHARDELGWEHVLARLTRNEVHPRQERAVDCTQRKGQA